MRKQTFHLVGYLAVVSFLSADAYADFINGYAWVTTDAIASSGTAASAASLSLPTCSHGTATCSLVNADVTFTTTGVMFTPPGLVSGTIAGWLASSGFPINNLVNTTAAGTPLSPTLWEFTGFLTVTGTVATPQVFSFSHDDGVTFIVNGQTVINAPGPTGPAVTPGSYTGGASTNAPFTLYYSECCTGSAVLTVSLLGPGSAPAGGVPEPTSVALVGGGLAALVFCHKKYVAQGRLAIPAQGRTSP